MGGRVIGLYGRVKTATGVTGSQAPELAVPCGRQSTHCPLEKLRCPVASITMSVVSVSIV